MHGGVGGERGSPDEDQDVLAQSIFVPSFPPSLLFLPFPAFEFENTDGSDRGRSIRRAAAASVAVCARAMTEGGFQDPEA
jgi:hypothetical protein